MTAGRWLLVALAGVVLLGGWVDFTFVAHGSRCLEPVHAIGVDDPDVPITGCPPTEPRHPRRDLAIWLGLLGGGGALVIAGTTGAVVAALRVAEIARISTVAGTGARDDLEAGESSPVQPPGG